MLTIKDLTVSYDRKTVLADLSINLELNRIHGFVGLNGSGKTTFLNTLYGLKRKDSGILLLDGKEPERKDVAYLETENFFYSNLTGAEYLDLFRSPFKEFNVNEWNDIFKLPLNSLIESYSTGMKRKLALVGVLKQDKAIVILDEPFNGLDIESSRILLLILEKFRERGKTIILTSHILESLTGICDYIHLLKDGKIAFTKDRSGFDSLEDEIFGKMEAEYKYLIDRIM